MDCITQKRMRLKKAKQEAARFLLAITAYEKRKTNEPDWYQCKQHAAMVRASMDLTRALADMRRPR